MQLSELDYQLPPERIAQQPLEERDASRMLILDRHSGTWEDRNFREFPALLRGDELLVVNNTRVIPARLLGRRAGVRSGPRASAGKARREFLQSPIEVLLLRRLADDTWEALVRPGRKIGSAKRFYSAKPTSSKPRSNGAANSACAACGYTRRAISRK